MSTKRQPARVAAQASKGKSNLAAVQRVFDNASTEIIQWFLPEVARLVLEFEHSGSGMIGHSRRTDPAEITRVLRAIAPVIPMLEVSFVVSFTKVFKGMLDDPEICKELIRGSARMAGKSGGRPGGVRRPHILWLSKQLAVIQRGEGPDDMNASDYFEELRNSQAIDGENDDGHLTFRRSVLESWGWTEQKAEPFISLNSVREELARLNRR